MEHTQLRFPPEAFSLRHFPYRLRFLPMLIHWTPYLQVGDRCVPQSCADEICGPLPSHPTCHHGLYSCKDRLSELLKREKCSVCPVCLDSCLFWQALCCVMGCEVSVSHWRRWCLTSEHCLVCCPEEGHLINCVRGMCNQQYSRSLFALL